MQFFQGKESERERFWQASLQLSRLISEAGTPVKQAAFSRLAKGRNPCYTEHATLQNQNREAIL